MVKNLPSNAWDLGSIPGSGRSPEGGHGNPLQSSCLENSMDRGAWRAIAHGVPKSRTGKQPEVGRHLRVLRNFRLQAFNNTNSPLEILWSWKSLSSSQMKRKKKQKHTLCLHIYLTYSFSWSSNFYLSCEFGIIQLSFIILTCRTLKFCYHFVRQKFLLLGQLTWSPHSLEQFCFWRNTKLDTLLIQISHFTLLPKRDASETESLRLSS